MKFIFFGSDDFAATHLEALVKAKMQVTGCVTQPDKPKGRGMKVVENPVKEAALQHKIPLWQPADIKDKGFLSTLSKSGADLFVVIAYGRILPSSVLNIPKTFSINVHASLLPKYRGAAPINWAIINGEQETGLSIIKMNEQMDAGDIVAQLKLPIEPQETAVTLRGKMAKIGPSFLVDTIRSIEKKGFRLVPQDVRTMTLAPKLTKELGKIDWNKSAGELDGVVRGLLPWPGAYTFYKGKMIKVLEAEVMASSLKTKKPGEVVGASAKGILVATPQGDLLIKKVHLESAKPMTAAEFLVGHALKPGDRLG